MKHFRQRERRNLCLAPVVPVARTIMLKKNDPMSQKFFHPSQRRIRRNVFVPIAIARQIRLFSTGVPFGKKVEDDASYYMEASASIDETIASEHD
jgi:hypothetical protein